MAQSDSPEKSFQEVGRTLAIRKPIKLSQLLRLSQSRRYTLSKLNSEHYIPQMRAMVVPIFFADSDNISGFHMAPMLFRKTLRAHGRLNDIFRVAKRKQLNFPDVPTSDSGRLWKTFRFPELRCQPNHV